MTDLSTEHLRVTIQSAVAKVTIDRAPVNAFTLQMYRDLGAIFQALGDMPDVHCIVLTAAGEKAFSAGFDFKLFQQDKAEDDVRRPLILRAMLEAVRTCALPVIAAVNGPALGAGCVLAAASDICVAVEQARFSLPEVDYGRVGGSAYVGSRTGKGFVRYMALTGHKVLATDARSAGLVDFLVAREDLESFVAKLAADIAAKSGPVLRHTKRALNQLEDLPVDQGYEVEQMHSSLARAGL